MFRAKVTSVLVVAGLSLATADARADDEARFHLVYEAPPSCPSSAAFLSAIRARTERPRLAGSGERATTFALRFEDDGGHAVGRLEIRDPDGSKQQRTVDSRSCTEVAKALALVVALVLDPDADTSREPAGAAEPAEEPEPGPRSPPPRPAPTRAPRTEDRPLRFVPAAGARLGARSGVGPSVAPFGGVFADVELEGARSPYLRPSLRLGVDLAVTSAERGVGSQAYFLAAATIDLCPVRVGLGRAIDVSPCLGMELGVHRGTSSEVVRASSHTELWLAPIGSASVRWEPSATVAIELRGGPAFPLRPTRFFLAPDLTLFRVPPVVAVASLAVSVRFR